MQTAEELMARWVLNDLPPEEVPRLAVEALQAGCKASAVAILAGLNRPTRWKVEAELPELLRHLGLSRPDPREALRIVGNGYARGIVEGSIAPEIGTRKLWRVANQFWDERWIFTQLSIFVGLASELEDHPEHRAQLEADVVAEAQALLDRGGIRIDSGDRASDEP